MFARVAFPAALPDALTYFVPTHLTECARPGVRVRARVRGTPRVGLITTCTDEPGCDPQRVLPLDEVLDVEPVVPAAVLDLILFAASYYFAPVGTVLRTAVPASLLRLPPVIVQVGPRAAELAARLDGEARRLLERLLEGRRVTVARLLAEGWKRNALTTLVEELAARSALRVVERRPRTDAGATVTAVALADLSGEERDRRIGRAPAQQRVVAWLEALGRPELEAELRASCGCSAGVVAELLRKGVVRRFQQRRHDARKRWELPPSAPVERLTTHQDEALSALRREIAANRFSGTLLLGVTGSGKTEVYLRLAADVVAAGRKVVVLVPEIGLTPALAGQLAARFGGRVAVVHSSMGEGERFAAWDRARRGEVDVVAGPRSALWTPLAPLGLVVVDEEQDASYKQDEEPRYHARDLALVLGKQLGIPVLLASATPSMEALWLARQGGLAVLTLPERIAEVGLPPVEVLDLRGTEGDPGEHGLVLISPPLRVRLGATLERSEQAILLVNRRGWAPVMLCRECGHQVTCRDCSIPLTVHRRNRTLACHYCGFTREIPQRCPRCGGEVLDHVGAGTEKVAERVRALFPTARVDILDRDTARSPAQLLATLERFAAGASDVLVGTQMVSKGHHFPRVTLTAVVNCDNLLGFPDFRGSERTFHLLTQVAGRSGRGEAPGTVLFQTYHPDHHAIVAAATHRVEAFAEEELLYRQSFRYPPYQRMALVRCESERESAAWDGAESCARAVEPIPAGVRVVGPAAAPLARLRGKFRVQCLLFAPTRAPLREALERLVSVPLPRAVRRVIDVDPQATV